MKGRPVGDRRLPIQFSDHVEGDGATFFRAAAELGLEGIVSNRMASRYCSGPSRSWLKTKNMVERDLFPRQQTPAYAIRQVE
jgi:ATP-dependent DNA ligase